MKYLLLLTPFVFIGCTVNNDTTAAYCKHAGYKGIVSEISSPSTSSCSNGEIMNEMFLTNNGEVPIQYSVKGTTYTREYIEFK